MIHIFLKFLTNPNKSIIDIWRTFIGQCPLLLKLWLSSVHELIFYRTFYGSFLKYWKKNVEGKKKWSPTHAQRNHFLIYIKRLKVTFWQSIPSGKCGHRGQKININAKPIDPSLHSESITFAASHKSTPPRPIASIAHGSSVSCRTAIIYCTAVVSQKSSTSQFTFNWYEGMTAVQ